MLMGFVSFLVALGCGILSGFGIGGGTVLMLWLSAVLSLEQQSAQGINLLYFFPTAICALIFHIRKKCVIWRCVIPAALCGCLSAVPGALLANRVASGLLRKLFGGFLLAVGLYEIFFQRNMKKRT